MASKQACIRKNFEDVAQQLADYANFPYTEKFRVKALGNDKYRVRYGTSFETIIDGDDCFSLTSMINQIVGFIYHFSEVAPECAGTGRWDGNSTVFGKSPDMIAEDDLDSVDCRLDYYDQTVNETFWHFDAVDFVPERLGEIIGDSPLSVYHYKGKYWRVAQNVVSIDITAYYLDEETREIEDYYEGEYEVLSIIDDNDKAVVEEVINFIQSIKDGVELEGISAMIHDKVMSLSGFFETTEVTCKHRDGTIHTHDLEDVLRDDVSEFVYKHYMRKDIERFNGGFNGPLLEPDEDAVNQFLKETYPELKVKDFGKMSKFAEKAGFAWEYDFNVSNNHYGRDTVEASIKFYNKEYSREHYHVSLEEFQDCDRNWKTVFRDIIQPMVRRRAMAEIERLVKTRLQGRLEEVAKYVWVSFADSIKAGNCEFGSRQFIERHGINLNELGAIRGDALLEIENSDYTRRIVMMKAANDAYVRQIVGL